MKYRVPLLAAAGLLLLTGCGRTQAQPEYSVVIEYPEVVTAQTKLTETAVTESAVTESAVTESTVTESAATESAVTESTVTETAETVTTAKTTAASTAKTKKTKSKTTTTAAETGGYTLTAELTESEPIVTEATLQKDGSYTTKEDVSLYLYTYGELPQNFITKKEAQALGWSGGSLEPYAPGKCIGGTFFGNYEGNLPKKNGREYHECDIDTLGKSSRGAKRLVYSNDGLIYYTGDHYKTFELLYGEE